MCAPPHAQEALRVHKGAMHHSGALCLARVSTAGRTHARDWPKKHYCAKVTVRCERDALAGKSRRSFESIADLGRAPTKAAVCGRAPLAERCDVDSNALALPTVALFHGSLNATTVWFSPSREAFLPRGRDGQTAVHRLPACRECSTGRMKGTAVQPVTYERSSGAMRPSPALHAHKS
jgi:hypothetical protein